MAPRKSPQHSPRPTSASAKKPYQLRSSPISKLTSRKTSGNRLTKYDLGTQTPGRPVLVPLHQNLRRLPSRLVSMPVFKGAEMFVGTKRKRMPSGTENARVVTKTAKAGRRFKRRKSIRGTSDDDDYTETESDSTMEVDEVEGDGPEDESSDTFFLRDAPQWRLLQLRKDQLVRLHGLADIDGDADALTKPDIISAIIDIRDATEPGPPTSPPPLTTDDEEFIYEKSNRPIIPLRRRATDNSFPSKKEGSFRPVLKSLKDRSYSLGNFLTGGRRFKRKSTTSSVSSNESIEAITPQSPPKPLPGTGRGRRKAKQVEFKDDVAIGHISDESAEFAEDENEEPPRTTRATINPSPRRLRSRDRGLRPDTMRRVTPMRKAKVKVNDLAESSSEDDDDVPLGGDDDEEEEAEAEEDDDDDDVPLGGDSDEEEENGDELNSKEEDSEDESVQSPEQEKPVSKSSTTSRKRNRRHGVNPSTPEPPPIPEVEVEVTPLKKRLRPRPGRKEDDYEKEDEEEADESEEIATVSEEESGDTAAETEVEDIVDAPRRLRNGKIVGEEENEEDDDDEMEVVEDDHSVEGVDELEETEEDEEDEEEEQEANDEGDDEMEESDVDLSEATAKGLVRLKRDDLVRLCESRDLRPAGTKMQLAKSLIGWRDRHYATDSSATSANGATSEPSSASTVRAPSTPRRTRKTSSAKRNGQATPVLLRSERIQADQPETPVPETAVVNDGNGIVPNDGELELDLESLGLEDREIPPDKLVKMEKIGSGGFKDVFVGKLRGRTRVAIAEFRSQLTPMDVKELKLLSDFEHPNIVRFLGVSIPENTKETPIMIVSELCSNGDLFDYVRNVPPPTLHKLLSLMLDIAQGLEYLHLHKPSIIHRDCKSSNILITAKITAKITDFGLAKVKQSTRSMVRSLVGTVNWQAPELWSPHPKYNHKVDVFSCACVFWEMLQWRATAKKFPWEGMNEHAIYDAVGTKKLRPSVSGLRKQWCPEIVDLMERMWAQDHQDRPTMSEVREELEGLLIEY